MSGAVRHRVLALVVPVDRYPCERVSNLAAFTRPMSGLTGDTTGDSNLDVVVEGRAALELDSLLRLCDDVEGSVRFHQRVSDRRTRARSPSTKTTTTAGNHNNNNNNKRVMTMMIRSNDDDDDADK
eukprot:1507452-Rhodomonas_salina.1